MRATPPTSEEALLARARALAGLTVRELGQKAGLRELPDPSRAKGILGELVERVLGATAGSKDEPDFPHLAEMIEHAVTSGYTYAAEFERGLDLVLDGLERVLERRA